MVKKKKKKEKEKIKTTQAFFWIKQNIETKRNIVAKGE